MKGRQNAVSTIFTFSKKRKTKRKSKNMKDSERRTLIQEAIASTSANHLPSSNSPFDVDENEVVGCPSIDEARFVSKECNSEISFPPNVYVEFVTNG